MPALVLRETPSDSAEVQLLLAEVQQFYVERYGGQDKAPADAAGFTAPDGAFWLAALSEQTVGCVGLRVGELIVVQRMSFQQHQ